MDFDGVDSIVCDAEENDWLDVSYSERNYVAEQPQEKKRFNFKFKLTKPIKIAAIALLCAALLAALLFVDGQFAKDVFETARAAYSASVFESHEQVVATATIAIPSNTDLVSVEEGVATFNGGRAVLSLCDGIVESVEEGSLTVALDETTRVVYGNLTDVYVAAGDAVSANSLLAKYDGNFTVAVTVNGLIVDVVASETQLAWTV